MIQQHLITYSPIVNEEGISTWKIFVTDEIVFGATPDPNLLGCIVKLSTSVREITYVKLIIMAITGNVGTFTKNSVLTWVSLTEEELPKDLRLFIYLTKDTYID